MTIAVFILHVVFSDSYGGWLQVDLLEDTVVAGIITQGRGDTASSNYSHYVKSYRVLYHKNGESSWKTVKTASGSQVSTYKDLHTPA